MIILNNQIKDHLLNSGTEMYYDDVRSRLYDMFNVTGYVQYDGDLFGSIDKLISEITVDPIYGEQTRSEFSITMIPTMSVGEQQKPMSSSNQDELENIIAKLSKRDKDSLFTTLLNQGAAPRSRVTNWGAPQPSRRFAGGATRKRGRTHKTKRVVRTNTRKSRS
jgi:hypothetical protein